MAEEVVPLEAQCAALGQQRFAQGAVHRAAGLALAVDGREGDDLVHDGIALAFLAPEVKGGCCALSWGQLGDGETRASQACLRGHRIFHSGRHRVLRCEADHGHAARLDIGALIARAAGQLCGDLLEAAEAVDWLRQVVDAQLAGFHGLPVGRGHRREVEVKGLVGQLHFFLAHLAVVAGKAVSA